MWRLYLKLPTGKNIRPGTNRKPCLCGSTNIRTLVNSVRSRWRFLNRPKPQMIMWPVALVRNEIWEKLQRSKVQRTTSTRAGGSCFYDVMLASTTPPDLAAAELRACANFTKSEFFRALLGGKQAIGRTKTKTKRVASS